MDELRCWQRLPQPAPKDMDPGPNYFYDNFASKFIADMIKMTNTGLCIDNVAVEKLRGTITEVLEEVTVRLGRNSIIRKYQEHRAVGLQEKHREKATQAIRVIGDFLRPYNAKDVTHRTWVVNSYLESANLHKDTKDKWTLKDIKKYCVWNPLPYLEAILDKRDISVHPSTKGGMRALAEYKLDLWNRPRMDSANTPVTVPPFNPGSAKQKQELFSMLKIEPFEVSDKTGDGSWGRDQVELLLKVTKEEKLVDVLEALVDHSFSGIIENNFLKAFDTYTIDGVLYGNIKLLGAKTARNTSNSPNLLNQPSTGSRYAKPLKKCFVAPEGMLVIQCDFTGLEDVILANISGDEGKIAILTDPTLDGHCYNGMGYFTEEVEAIIGKEGTFKDKVRKFKEGVKEGNQELKDLRQDGKPHTFKLAYGGFPDDHKGGKITQLIFDNFHNVLYPGVTKFREEYVLPTAKKQGYIHCGLGFRIYTDDPDKNIRTLNNSCSQFWSVLTLIAVNEINYRIVEAGYEKDIQLCATIYDSIYAYITPDPKIIQWYNDNIYEIGNKDFMENQVVPNVLTCGVGRNWAEELDIPVGASAEDIQEILTEIKESNE